MFPLRVFSPSTHLDKSAVGSRLNARVSRVRFPRLLFRKLAGSSRSRAHPPPPISLLTPPPTSLVWLDETQANHKDLPEDVKCIGKTTCGGLLSELIFFFSPQTLSLPPVCLISAYSGLRVYTCGRDQDFSFRKRARAPGGRFVLSHTKSRFTFFSVKSFVDLCPAVEPLASSLLHNKQWVIVKICALWNS